MNSVQFVYSRVASAAARVLEKAGQTSVSSASTGNQPSDDVVGLHT